MFFLSSIEHTLRLPPISLKLTLNEGIKRELEKLFVDKVIPKLGLCISIYDISDIEGGFVYPGQGAPTYTVKFRLVMFRPYVGEVIVAKLKECNSEGLRLSLGFFDDIFVPAILMPTPSRFEPDPENENYNKWIWEYGEKSEDNEESGDKFCIEGPAEIRFRVHAVKYPALPIIQPEALKPFAPMEIDGSIDCDGLGPISWWLNTGEEEEEEDVEVGANSCYIPR